MVQRSERHAHPVRLAIVNERDAYWTVLQQLAVQFGSGDSAAGSLRIVDPDLIA